MKDPLIFDIKRSSLEDGPGLRTTVFLKGCNLNCFWCHNPEGKSPERQTAWFREKCVRCGVCMKEENAALSGEARAKLRSIRDNVRYINLPTHPSFGDAYVEGMLFA